MHLQLTAVELKSIGALSNYLRSNKTYLLNGIDGKALSTIHCLRVSDNRHYFSDPVNLCNDSKL